MLEGDIYRARSVIGSEFVCRIARSTTVGVGQPSSRPVSGRAWITGVNQYMVAPPILALGLPARGHLAALERVDLSVYTVRGRSVDAKMAMKYPPHDLLSSHKPDFKNFVRRLA